MGSAPDVAGAAPRARRHGSSLDRRDLAWYVDKVVQVLVFLGGVSAIVFILGIFFFVFREGLGFLTTTFDFREFFGSIRWQPTSSSRPTYRLTCPVTGSPASATGSAASAPMGCCWAR